MFSLMAGCVDQGDDVASHRIDSDADLFHLVAVEDPFSSYSLFPNADSVTSGTLNGSTAHQPLVRVSLNAVAFNALSAGRLPAGSSFPNGSIVFKEIRRGDSTYLYAVIYKDPSSPYAGNGWLWAELYPNGAPFISMTLSGRNCTGCHAREQGPQNDFVRTFERQEFE